MHDCHDSFREAVMTKWHFSCSHTFGVFLSNTVKLIVPFQDRETESASVGIYLIKKTWIIGRALIFCAFLDCGV